MDNDQLKKMARYSRMLKLYSNTGRTDEFWSTLGTLLDLIETEENKIDVNS